ncbi:MAG: 4Fe-4S binding protein [Candidatus Aureabacteria bacterium]|nr:4Fe-4S binding protein [Candidatus Auribacterota bacterium]
MNLFWKTLEPFSSPFLLLFFLLFFHAVNRSRFSYPFRLFILAVMTGILYFAYSSLGINEDWLLFLKRLNSPFVLALSLLVVPAVILYGKKIYPLFLIVPIFFLELAIWKICSSDPLSGGFHWFRIPCEYLIMGVVSFLVILSFFLSVDTLRKGARITFFILLIYGGFVFRQDESDYQFMLTRRGEAIKGKFNAVETHPVLGSENALSYLPSAPCRFSADGGYVQGCVMELLQRIYQFDDTKSMSSHPGFTAFLSMILSALLFLILLHLIGARFWCGWICPLSTLGDLLDTLRRWVRFPHYKPPEKLKMSFFYSGFSWGVLGLLLAKAYAKLGPDGTHLGCRIPLYPFCRLCPGQLVCPAASRGWEGHFSLPGMEWMFGLFKIGAVTLLTVYLLSFLAARRLWCRFCPMGMIGGLFNRVSLLRLSKNSTNCSGCGTCNEVCPMNIHHVQEEMKQKNVSHFDCLLCLKCVTHCPKKKCLSLEFCGKVIKES